MKYIDVNRMIPDLIERIINCTGLEKVYTLVHDSCLENVCGAIRIEYIDMISQADDKGLLFVSIEDFNWEEVISFSKKGVCIVKTKNTLDTPDECTGIIYDLCNITAADDTRIVLMGSVFSYKQELTNKTFRVLAIMHVYNEADILEQTIQYLLNQDIDVYIVDNWSTDESYEIACRIKNDNPNRVFVERFPVNGYKQKHKYEWYKQLERTEQISGETDYNWYIHYDVDEIRLSPWKNITLKDALCYIDSLGYNCVENTVIDFRLTSKDEEIFNKNAYYEMRVSVYTEQLKTWKKCESIDLKESAGHKVKFVYPKIFPLKILNKHYPMRSLKQASKKIFNERKNDYCDEEKITKGWHTQYDRLNNEDDLIYEKSSLLYWDDNTYDKYYITLFTECGLDKKKLSFDCAQLQLQGKKVILYGAGTFGEYIINKLGEMANIVGWYDKAYEYMPSKYGRIIQNPDFISDNGIDYVVIAIRSEKVRNEVKKQLIEKGICDHKIIYAS